MQTHRINHLRLDFSFGSEEKEIALQQTRDFFYEQVMPQLDAQFNKHKEYLYIDKLEIEVGHATASEFEIKFRKAFSDTWNELLFHRQEENWTMKDSLIPGTGTKNEMNAESASFNIAVLMHFLEKGYWPWNFQAQGNEELIEQVRIIFQSPTKAQLLFHQLQASKHIYTQRLLQLVHGEHVLLAPFITAIAANHPLFAGNEDTLRKILTLELRRPSLNFLGKILQRPSLTLVAELLQALEEINPSVVAMRIATKKDWERLMQFVGEIIREKGTKSEIAVFERRLNEMKKDLLPGIASKPVEEQQSDTEESISISINNAGLVLFHPYLRYAFRELNWIGSDLKFVDKERQQKAILFLQYLINGRSRQPEHQLVLNKLICNWPIELPMKTRVHFSAKEKGAVLNLVESLKEDWASLKNTSLRGLVSSFVERKGLIRKVDQHYVLQVEKKTIDILMESLPFSIQVIKLPWNEYLIYSEWIQ